MSLMNINLFKKVSWKSEQQWWKKRHWKHCYIHSLGNKGGEKKEIITDVITEVNNTLTKELSTTVKTQVKDKFIKEIDEKPKIFESHTNEIADGMKMDMNDLKEKFH